MFKAPNPYEDLVVKATDEGLTSENWQLNLDLCDKLSDNNEGNARLMLAAIQRRLAHRNTNVQLYALTLTDMLSKNCGTSVHHEIASRAFMHTLSRLVMERTTHALVKKRILTLLREWANEYKDDDTLALVSDTMRSLREEYFEADDDTVATTNADAAERLRREEEELQRALALSVQDQGGRVAPEPAQPVASSSSARGVPNTSTSSSSAAPAEAMATPSVAPPAAQLAAQPAAPPAAQPAASPVAPSVPSTRPSFVRALYDFEPDEPGELAFSAGDVIRVLDSVYEQWWRGELRQDVGIFPVNYVEPMPEMAQAAIEQDLEMERSVFAHAADIHRLHARLQQLDPVRDNFVDDDELQELYQRSLALRPKIIRLMDRYSVKVQDLRAMNDKFMRARSTFEELIAQRMEQYAVQGAQANEAYAAQAHAAPQDAGYAAGPSRAEAYDTPRASTAAEPAPYAPPTVSTSSAAAYTAPPPDLGPVPQEEEKRRLFERARAEVEAYQRAHHPDPEDEPASDTRSAPPSHSAAESLAGLHLS
ncbi:hypothetical protein MBRA1_001306 [Malassezia brasiliensis]|uniref:Class E vacuolar protein-sorting machinery protein HSE1 n=1 Tax=Malassezia brasiliensis TaxID=1821822 RepID=A0AAF0DSK2_9BASI|nr:hypothetical protein MBRA1_001306 [Malassezia brasiliensis]